MADKPISNEAKAIISDVVTEVLETKLTAILDKYMPKPDEKTYEKPVFIKTEAPAIHVKDNSDYMEKYGSKFGRFVHIVAAAPNMMKHPVDVAKHVYDKDKSTYNANMVAIIEKSLGTVDFSAGGAFVPEDLYDDIIQYIDKK